MISSIAEGDGELAQSIVLGEVRHSKERIAEALISSESVAKANIVARLA